MLKKTLPLLILPLLVNATTFGELFDALKHHSQTKSDEMILKKAEVAEDMAHAKLYPNIDLFAKYDHYTTPTGMISVPPNELLPMVQNQSLAQPFSQNIRREGVSFTMPVFVKPLFTMADKAKMMQRSAKAKRYINLLKNEALIVGANANLIYLVALEKSLNIKKKSLKETQKTVKIKVDNGRTPASALYKIDDGLNEINIIKNSIKAQKEQLLNSIRTLTGITLKSPIYMNRYIKIKSLKEIKSLKPLKLKIKASSLELKAQKEKLYPSVVAYGNYVLSQADAYNNDKSVNEHYGNIGIAIKIPLLAMDKSKDIQKAKIDMMNDIVELEKFQDELSSKSKMLKNSLPLLGNSIKLSKKSIINKKKLLKIAKVNFKSGRLAIEEYLRYEDDVVEAKAKLYKTEAQRWQIVMQLAVIYAKNIEEMVR